MSDDDIRASGAPTPRSGSQFTAAQIATFSIHDAKAALNGDPAGSGSLAYYREQGISDDNIRSMAG